ncbi:MAG: molybdopterin biosynthesis protein MoeB [Pirellulaceae bacterium]|nr:MAG: molybdopterin biosynthesis protein MoeB [Pirellulaceae bacterium]
MSEADHRYARQIRFAPLGEAGQRLLRQSRVLLCGCGALGTAIAERLARSGVGALRIVDRDWVEWSNLQRQCLFTERDAAESIPKAVAAAAALQAINSEVDVDPRVEDISYRNLPALAEGCDLILDGTDNFETRFLLNDYAVSQDIAWVHGGCLGAAGQVLGIIPGKTACFRCLIPDPPPAGSVETCDTAGVLAPAVGVVANWQAALALKILSGHGSELDSQLVIIDTWNVESRKLALPRNPNCPCCGQRRFPFLNGTLSSDTNVLCGKNAVQIHLATPVARSTTWSARLREAGEVVENRFFTRLKTPSHTLTIFPDGRVVVEGTTVPATARSVVAQVLGM